MLEIFKTYFNVDNSPSLDILVCTFPASGIFFLIDVYWRSRRRGLNGTIQCVLQVTEQVENENDF